MSDLFSTNCQHVDMRQPAVGMTADELLRLLCREVPKYRLDYGDEMRLHDQLVRVFTAVLPDEPITREFTLDLDSRIDFYVARVRVGLEVKVAGSISTVFRQLQRYLTSPMVDHLVLITGRLRLADSNDLHASVAVPAGKTLTIIPLGRQLV